MFQKNPFFVIPIMVTSLSWLPNIRSYVAGESCAGLNAARHAPRPNITHDDMRLLS